ncbi:MAG: UTP--glucose-1-phosphate uridylyltransferase [Micrococcales bacterium]|nr:UTP--glucose-1-phosphate uridylyltransferase [Micrococcales bacterium]
MSITKAVIPVAGLGTRFLPATKTVAKELLPVVDTPAIDFVVKEAAAAGLSDVLLITAKAKSAILDYFDRAWDLEETLIKKGDASGLEAIRGPAEYAKIHSLRQENPLGLGHAVSLARQHVDGQAFAVLLGDDLIDPRDPLLTSMLAVQKRLGGTVVAMMQLPEELIAMYGSAVAKAVNPALLSGVPVGPDKVYHLTELVEKPPIGQAPSQFGIIGRYILDPAVFDVLDKMAPGANGEIQLTDAMAVLATMPPAAGGGVHGVVFDGRRHDTGNKLEYLKAVVRLAVEHHQVGPAFTTWLQGFIQDELPTLLPEKPASDQG